MAWWRIFRKELYELAQQTSLLVLLFVFPILLLFVIANIRANEPIVRVQIVTTERITPFSKDEFTDLPNVLRKLNAPQGFVIRLLWSSLSIRARKILDLSYEADELRAEDLREIRDELGDLFASPDLYIALTTQVDSEHVDTFFDAVKLTPSLTAEILEDARERGELQEAEVQSIRSKMNTLMDATGLTELAWGDLELPVELREILLGVLSETELVLLNLRFLQEVYSFALDVSAFIPEQDSQFEGLDLEGARVIIEDFQQSRAPHFMYLWERIPPNAKEAIYESADDSELPLWVVTAFIGVVENLRTGPPLDRTLLINQGREETMKQFQWARSEDEFRQANRWVLEDVLEDALIEQHEDRRPIPSYLELKKTLSQLSNIEIMASTSSIHDERETLFTQNADMTLLWNGEWRAFTSHSGRSQRGRLIPALIVTRALELLAEEEMPPFTVLFLLAGAEAVESRYGPALLYPQSPGRDVSRIPAFIALVIAFYPFFLISESLSREKAYGSLQVLLCTSKVGWIGLVLGKSILPLFVTSLVSIVLLAFSSVLFEIGLKPHFVSAALTQMLAMSGSLFMGWCLGSLAGSQVQVYCASAIYLLCLITLTGFIFPLEQASSFVFSLSHAFPLSFSLPPLESWMKQGLSGFLYIRELIWLIALSVVYGTSAGLSLVAMRRRI